MVSVIFAEESLRSMIKRQKCGQKRINMNNVFEHIIVCVFGHVAVYLHITGSGAGKIMKTYTFIQRQFYW